MTGRESLLAAPGERHYRAGAPQILRATVERCRREAKHLEWVDVDDLATVLDSLACLRDAVAHVVDDSPGTPDSVKQFLAKALRA